MKINDSMRWILRSITNIDYMADIIPMDQRVKRNDIFSVAMSIGIIIGLGSEGYFAGFGLKTSLFIKLVKQLYEHFPIDFDIVACLTGLLSKL